MRPKFSPTIVKFGLQVMSPVLVPLFWIMGKAYKVCFGRADLRMSKEAEEKLGHEVLSDLPFLFDDYGGRLCSDETLKHPRPFDYAVVLVVLDSLSLRFIRGRGEFRVQMAARQTPEAWEDLATALTIVDERFESRFFSSVTDVAAALEPRMPRLQGALSADQYPELQKNSPTLATMIEPSFGSGKRKLTEGFSPIGNGASQNCQTCFSHCCGLASVLI